MRQFIVIIIALEFSFIKWNVLYYEPAKCNNDLLMSKYENLLYLNYLQFQTILFRPFVRTSLYL